MAKKNKSEATPIEGLYQQAISYAAEAFRAGHSDLEVARVVAESFPILTEANVQLVIHKGSQLIANQFVRDRKNIVALHVRRYNQDIDKLYKKKYDDLMGEDDEKGMDGAKRRKMRIDALFMMLDVMLAKEKVLQIHAKETQIKIFNKLNAKITQKKVMFNLADLTLQEKIEFLSLIQKAKKTQTELFSVKKSELQSGETVDADYEIVENNNINEIKRVNEPVPLPPPKPKKNLNTVQEKLRKALERKALKDIRAVGGGKGGPHIKDYTDGM